jgi:chemotaxis protein histidine kinase CheA
MAYDPEAQRQILRDFTLAITDDPGRTEAMVPDEPEKMNSSVFAAQAAMGTLMKGLPVGVLEGINHIDYIDAMLISLQVIIGQANQHGGMASPEDIQGMGNTAQHITQHIAIVAEDPEEKQRVAAWKQTLSKMMNMVRAFAQRAQEQAQQQQQQGGNGQDAEAQAKIQAMLMQAKAKADNTRESHAQRTAQRQLQWEMEQKRKDQEVALEERRKQQETQAEHQERMLDVQAEAAKTRMNLMAEHAGHRMAIGRKRAETEIELEAAKKLAKIKPKAEKKK